MASIDDTVTLPVSTKLRPVSIESLGSTTDPTTTHIPRRERPDAESVFTPIQRRNKKPWPLISFIALVLAPTFVIGVYYALYASGQFRSEVLFSVRGTTTSPLAFLGIATLPGASSQSGDAYIVADYIQSKQVLVDINNALGTDVRKMFSRSEIDSVYRIDPAMPMEEFLEYWNWMTDVEFNSTTGVITFRANAFTADDAQTISASVLRVSEKLVNTLSDKARQQLISTAQEEVARTEKRLIAARQSVEAFRNREQALDPEVVAETEQSIIKQLQASLAELRVRRSVLGSTAATNSPSIRILDRQIEGVEKQIESQKRRVGSGLEADQNEGGNRNLSSLLTDYKTLLLEQEFAEKAYTSALSSAEGALSEARKQERYFAIVLEPSPPEVAMFPLRIINTICAFAALTLLWLLGYLLVQSVRDHSI